MRCVLDFPKRWRWGGCILLLSCVLADPAAGEAQETAIRPLPPLTSEQIRRVRAIAARAPAADTRLFMKIGDSMTVNQNYLRCFAASRVELGAHAELEEGRQFFRAGSPNPFRRRSLAARVGWSTNHVLAGRPSPLRREYVALRPRFATLMLGTNEVESRAPRRFARRIWRILDELTSRGVVPLTSAIPPRGDDPDEDAWVPHYNLILRGLSEGRDLPFYDLHADYLDLPERGLAHDGVHANVRMVGRRMRACDFSPEGLRFGHNVRNLRTLQHLDRLRRMIVGEDVEFVSASPPSPETHHGVELGSLPLVKVTPLVGPEPLHFSFTVAEEGRVRILAVAKEGNRLEIELEGHGHPRRTSLTKVLEPGNYRLTVRGASRTDTEMLLVIDRPT
ncbi:MAG: SGNH/GDSL hydrolase family protein [Myxococcota bacterium]